MKVDIYDIIMIAALSAIAGSAIHFHKWVLVALLFGAITGLLYALAKESKKNER